MRPVTEQVVDFQLQVSDSVPLSVRKESAHQCGRCDRPNLGVRGRRVVSRTRRMVQEEVSIRLSPRRERRETVSKSGAGTPEGSKTRVICRFFVCLFDFFFLHHKHSLS